MKESTAWLLTSAMEDVISKGTGSRLKFKKINMPQAGKTGTSTGNRDLWFVGYTPYLTAGIWGGYDSGQKQTSLTYQKDLWRDTMEKLNQNYTKFHSRNRTLSQPLLFVQNAENLQSTVFATRLLAAPA